MNLIELIARSAIAKWQRFTQYLESSSRVQDSIQLIQEIRHAVLTCGFTNVFDRAGTLQARAPKGLTPSRLSVARGVAAVIGISLCMPMAQASSGSIDAINPKTYIRLTMDHREALCLIKLYGKESAFNPYAIGNLQGKYQTYGIPQLKNALIADKTPIQQIHYGLKYIDKRYDGDTCKAWTHWIRKGWH